MVPAPGSALPESCPGHVPAPRALGRSAFTPLLLALGLIPAAPLRADEGSDITWKSAFIAGLEARRTAHTGSLTVAGRTPLELFLVVEGDRGGGLPIYCTTVPTLRIEGRAVPKKMLITPERAGLVGLEIRWQSLRPTDDGRSWTRQRIDAGDHRWSLESTAFPGGEEAGAFPLGTMRFAVAIRTPGGLLGSDGWSIPRGTISPEEAPGFRVTRYAGPSVSGRAEGFGLLPVIPDLPVSYPRNKVALSPVDLVLGAYEDLGQVELDAQREVPLDDDAWSWLFETVVRDLRRRSVPAALVGPGARGVPWGPGVQIGDILLAGGVPAILYRDDGDGWLGEADLVLSTVSGQVARGPLSEVPGPVHVLRPRLFIAWRERLRESGYGELGQIAWFSANLAQAFREFQRDQGLPETGYPDEATAAALDAFLNALDSAATTPASPR